LYAEVLNIFERLGDQGGRASTLGQLGLLAHQQRDYQAAVQYTAHALTIFEGLHSPSRDIALRELSKLSSELGESAFALLWQNMMHGQPLPELPAVDHRQVLVDGLISFIQAETWIESQRLLEAHPEFLDTEADTLLEQLAAAQQDDGLKQLIGQHRALLARCREVGIVAAFAELHGQKENRATDAFATQLNVLCQQVVVALQIGDVTQSETLATRLDEMVGEPMPLEGVGDFLMLLAAWLRGEDITAQVETLQPAFQEAYQQMVAGLSQLEQPAIDPHQILLQRLVDFIQAETWTESQHLLEAHPEFLSTEVDALLVQPRGNRAGEQV
jgi:hypothetical protein